MMVRHWLKSLVSGLFFLFFFTGYVSVIILITGHSLYTESTKQMSIN